MNIKTVRETARLLGVQEIFLRRMIREGKLRHMLLGNRVMLDVDEAREAVAIYDGADISEVMAETGLTESAIRRGCREGWIPYRLAGRALRFDIEAVKQAIESIMK